MLPLSRLFARKFDPNDKEIFDVLDKVRDGEQPWRRGPTFDYISIRSASSPAAAGGGRMKWGRGLRFFAAGAIVVVL